MDIQEFLNANRIDNIFKEVKVSDRICTADGKPYLFKIKALSMEEFQRAKAKTDKSGRGSLNGFKSAVVISGCVEPNFKDAKSLKALGAALPEDYLKKVLLAGEISRLAGEILKLSGFGDGYGA